MYSSRDLKFYKSSYSASVNECVEVAQTRAGAAMRDTQHRYLGHLEFSSTEWQALLAGVKIGEL